MKKQIAAVMVLSVALLMSGCDASAQEPQPEQEQQLPANALNIQATVLDITPEMLIVRTNAGQEYVLRLDGDEIAPDTKILSGAYVSVDYIGDLVKESTAPDVLRVSESTVKGVEDYDSAMVAQGRIVKVNDKSVSLRTASGKVYEFSVADAVQRADGALREGMWVRVIFDGSGIDTHQAAVREISQLHRTQDAYAVTGMLSDYDKKEKTALLKDDTRQVYRVQMEHAAVELDDPAQAQKVTVMYHERMELDEQGQLVLQADRVAEPDSKQSFCAIVESYDEKTGELKLHRSNGAVLSIKIDSKLVPREGLDTRDLVEVFYRGAVSETAVSAAVEITAVKSVQKAEKAELLLLGVVHQLDEKGLVLRTPEGRNVLFENKASKNSISPAVTVGDKVCVYYSGWLSERPDQGNEMAQVTHISRWLS